MFSLGWSAALTWQSGPSVAINGGMGARIMVDLERSYGILASDRLWATLAREALKHSFEVLRDNPTPDTFAGRKTQEPFPHSEKPERIEEY